MLVFFYINAILVLLEHATCLLKHQLPYSMFVAYSNALCVYMLHTSLPSRCTSIQQNVVLWLPLHCHHYLYGIIVKIVYITVLLHLSLNLNTSFTFVHINQIIFGSGL